VAFLLVFILTGCDVAHTVIRKRHLDVQTKMNATVFLDPVSAQKKTIYVQLKNTSGKPEMNLKKPITALLREKGYKLVEDPEEARYLLQVNVLQVARSDLKAAEQALKRGFGKPLLSGKQVPSKVKKVVAAGACLGNAVSKVASAMVQDIVYTVITDVQISEHTEQAVAIKEKIKSTLKQGTRGSKNITATEIINWKRYQTRVVSTANRVNLQFEQAVSLLITGLSRSIAGIF
jgi:hypothetical protein